MLCLPFLLVDNSIVSLGPQPSIFKRMSEKQAEAMPSLCLDILLLII